jgi:hypothetical protein
MTTTCMAHPSGSYEDLIDSIFLSRLDKYAFEIVEKPGSRMEQVAELSDRDS